MQKCPHCRMRKVKMRTVRDDKGNVIEVTSYCENCKSVIRWHKRPDEEK